MKYNQFYILYKLTIYVNNSIEPTKSYIQHLERYFNKHFYKTKKNPLSF